MTQPAQITLISRGRGRHRASSAWQYDYRGAGSSRASDRLGVDVITSLLARIDHRKHRVVSVATFVWIYPSYSTMVDYH